MLSPAAPFLALLAVPIAAPSGGVATEDLRTHYDVQTYRIDIALDPRSRTVTGTVAVEATVVAPSLSRLVLDLQPPLEVRSVVGLAAPLEPRGPLGGPDLAFDHKDAALSVLLAEGHKRGETVRIAVSYGGRTSAENSFDGFHWAKTEEGKTWISTSSQGTGSSAWWPSKDSYWHPEDKPQRTFVNLTVPAGLVGVSNGRLTGREEAGEGRATFHWVHDYPCPTYSIGIAASAYESVEDEVTLPGLEEALPFAYYVLPENLEKAKVQFAEVPRLLEVFTQAFGPFPFPKSKYALVETSFWGMENSTCIAYGSSYPAWCRQNGETDAYASMNGRFDYILVHETAHEWWGNAVTAQSWGDFWIHEGFATYAEAVYLEQVEGLDVAEDHLDGMRGTIPKDARLFRGEGVDSGEAYSPVLYAKGAWVLHTLRQYVDDDETWWEVLREFNLAHRYRNAGTDDFRKILEERTGKPWKVFFDEWVFGEGHPVLQGTVRTLPKGIVVELRCQGTGKTGFHVPIDLYWTEGDAEKHQRPVLEPGENRIEFACKARPREVEIAGLGSLLVESSILYE